MYHSLNSKLIKPVVTGSLVISALVLSGCNSSMLTPTTAHNPNSRLTLEFDNQGGVIVKGTGGIDDLNRFERVSRAEADQIVKDAYANIGSARVKDERIVWRIRGSHYYLYCLRSSCYKIPL